MQDLATSAGVGDRLTIGIPVRVDSDERKANLLAVVRYLSALRCRVIVLEADAQPKAGEAGAMDGVDYLFVEDTNPIFHRTRYINRLLRMSQTEAVAIWDTDVIMDYRQILEALRLIDGGATIAYPYDGRFVMLAEDLSRQMRGRPDLCYLHSLRMKSFIGRKLCGGAYLVHKQRYLQCGGENERFTGWGPEDAERIHRVAILGHRACHIASGELFHLYHPRGRNSTYQSKEDARKLREEFIRVCCMSPEELKTYIQK